MRTTILALLVTITGGLGRAQGEPPPPPSVEAPETPLEKLKPGEGGPARPLPEAPRDTAAAAPRPLPSLDRYRDDPAFQYERVVVERESLLARFLRWVDRTFFRPIRENTSAGARELVYLFFALGVLAWVFVRLFRADGGGLFGRKSKEAPGGPVLLDAEDIAAVDLDALLAEARREGRFRDAVRYQYLLGLQKLATRGIIDWRKDKTNREYLAEVRRAAGLAEPFAEVTRLFEWVWYGEAAVDAPAFAAVEARFDRLAEALDGSTAREGTRR
ncbi:MAG TPA: DUF4129 domain-containing protein [Rubricoccaceae bacterium]|nr:DUF4129 domain-containing protein [Rubricoccaceae bacterium]